MLSLQVNTSGEESKFGVEPGECIDLAAHIHSSCPSLRLVLSSQHTPVPSSQVSGSSPADKLGYRFAPQP